MREKMNNGYIEKQYKKIMQNSMNNDPIGVLDIYELNKYIKSLINLSLDCHILIVGQNGLSKSYTAMMLSKILDPDFFKKDNIIYAYNEVSDFIQKVRKKQKSILLIDELSTFFGSKLQM